MKNLRISLLFFTLCITFSNALFAQSQSDKSNSIPNIDSLLTHLDLGSILHQVNVDSIMHNVNVDSIMHRVNFDSIMRRVNVDSILKITRSKIDSMLGSRDVTPKSPSRQGNINGTQNYSTPDLSRHYFAQNGKKYYIDIIPAQKGIRVDHSDAWLIETR